MVAKGTGSIGKVSRTATKNKLENKQRTLDLRTEDKIGI